MYLKGSRRQEVSFQVERAKRSKDKLRKFIERLSWAFLFAKTPFRLDMESFRSTVSLVCENQLASTLTARDRIVSQVFPMLIIRHIRFAHKSQIYQPTLLLYQGINWKRETTGVKMDGWNVQANSMALSISLNTRRAAVSDILRVWQSELYVPWLLYSMHGIDRFPENPWRGCYVPRAGSTDDRSEFSSASSIRSN